MEIRPATAASASRSLGGHLLVLRLLENGPGLALVQHLEARCHACFEREALQQRLAEGVDRKNVDAARRVEHAGEQAAGDHALLRFRRAIDQLGDLRVESGLLGQSPAPELGGEAVAHLGRGCLGESEAKDALGLDAGQQQARHAVGQHLGLAGAGIGLDPGRLCGRRRLALLGGGDAYGVPDIDAHSSLPPVVDHSATRSSCS